MPAEFLIPEQRQGYGRYANQPTPEKLAHYDTAMRSTAN